MRKFDIKKLFQCLANFEYELLKYIYRTQGEASAPINQFEAATALSAEKETVRKAIKRLVDANVLIVSGEDFKINEDIFKDEGTSADK